MNLRNRTFSAIRWTTLNTLGKIFFRVASIAVLARLLAPEDYGLMAIVTVVVGFAGLFADMGINSAFVQKREVSVEQRSSLFWLNVFSSLVIAAVVVVGSSFVATIYDEPRLAQLLMLTSSIFVFRALGQQVRMAAEKELRFRGVVVVDLTAALAGFIAAVAAAHAGWGVYALVVSAVLTATLETILYWIKISDGWRPLFRFRVIDVRPFLRFGSASVGNTLVNYLNNSVDIFLGGRALDSSSLGYYSLPRALTMQVGTMVNATVTRVGFPLISQVQANIDQVRSIYLRTLNMTAATNAPIYLAVAFYAPEIVGLVLGPNWERSELLLRVLAVWGGLRATSNPVGSLMFGLGRAGTLLIWTCSVLLITILAVWKGSLYGPEGLAWALLATQVGLFVPVWYFLVRPACQARGAAYFYIVLRPFGLALIAIAPGYWMASYFDSALLRLVIGVAVAVPLYLLLSSRTNREWIESLAELVGRPLAGR